MLRLFAKRHHLFPISILHKDNYTKVSFDENIIKPTEEDFRILELLLRSKYTDFRFDYNEFAKGNLYLANGNANPVVRDSLLRRAEADVIRWLKTFI